jgi:hypothetical protein
MANAQQDNSNGSADAPPAENGEALASSSVEDEWDEERLEKAMKTLKEMHIQVGNPKINCNHSGTNRCYSCVACAPRSQGFLHL